MNNIWKFVEDHFPGYSNSPLIARSNDLQKILDGELEGEAKRIYYEEYFHTSGNSNIATGQVAKDLRDLNSVIYEMAIEGYQAKQKNEFSHVWKIQDIIDRAKGKLGRYLTEQQAREIADQIISEHEKGVGIDWSVIDHYIIKNK